MSERVEIRDLAGGLRRRLWIPVLCTLIGVVLGVTAAMNVPPLYRSEATVLVGPTKGSVTHSATIRTSENLATFYADMARRQIVLGPVVERLGLDTPWGVLRNQVSAVVPPQNLRLVTVTVMGEDQGETNDVANEIVSGLVALSPTMDAETAQQFINDQAAELRTMIEAAQQTIRTLELQISRSTDPVEVDRLERKVRRDQGLVRDWQRNYVELIGAEPSSDAGGLQVIDEATAVTDMGRAGLYRQGVIGGFVGGAVGLLIAWMLHSRARRRRAVRATRYDPAVVTSISSTGPMPAPAGEGRNDEDEEVLAGAAHRRSSWTPPGGRTNDDVNKGDWG